MQSIWTTVTALALLLLNPIHAFTAFTPEEYQAGKASFTPEEYLAGQKTGFTGGDYAYSGDCLISTWCFCAQPTPTPHENSEGNWFQFEYYNSRSNTTYILTHLCLAGPDSLNTCLAPREEDGDPDEGDFINPCRTFFKHKEPFARWDDPKMLCYHQSDNEKNWRDGRMVDGDTILWDGQKRKLDTAGKQGPVLKSKEEAEAKCDVMCDQQLHMPALKNNLRNQCKLIVYSELDAV